MGDGDRELEHGLVRLPPARDGGGIVRAPPRGFDRSFNNVPEDMAPERQNCTGQKCKDCMLCYTIGNGVDTIVEKVKKY